MFRIACAVVMALALGGTATAATCGNGPSGFNRWMAEFKAALLEFHKQDTARELAGTDAGSGSRSASGRASPTADASAVASPPPPPHALARAESSFVHRPEDIPRHADDMGAIKYGDSGVRLVVVALDGPKRQPRQHGPRGQMEGQVQHIHIGGPVQP